MKVLDRQVFDRGGPLHVQAFLHAVLFPSVRLLVVHPQQTRIRTLTVAVTLGALEANKLAITKWLVFSGTPCSKVTVFIIHTLDSL